MGTKPKENLIYGSTALKHWLPNIKREPKDIDILSSVKIDGADCSFADEFNYVLMNNKDDKFVDLDLLYTIKLSHLCYDLKNNSWNKHKYDVMYMQQQGISNVHMDWHLYKSRHLVENAFCRIKHYRGIATRYEKLKRNYENLVALAFAYHWLKL